MRLEFLIFWAILAGFAAAQIDACAENAVEVDAIWRSEAAQ